MSQESTKEDEAKIKTGFESEDEEKNVIDAISSILKSIQSDPSLARNTKIKRKLHTLMNECLVQGIAQKEEEKEKEKEQILAFEINIDAVLKHLYQDMRDDWFTDALQHRDLFDRKSDLPEKLRALILEGNGKYLGAHRTIYDIPKKNVGIRYTLETDFYDRFIYQAICSFLMPFYDPLLSNRVLGHRYNKKRLSEKYIFKPRIELWSTFEGVTRTAFKNNQALLATDLINYFENISIISIKSSFERGLEKITASGPQKLLILNAIDTLCELLTRWGYNEHHGLPQNRDASSFIANVVLSDVDHKMEELGYDYYRYVDDIRIICDTPRLAKKALAELINQLRTVGMNINSGKTKILTSESPKADIDEYFPTSDDRSTTINSMWRSRSRRVIARSAKYIHQLLLECIHEKQTQSRQFRFATNRLIHLIEAKLFDIHSDLSSELKNLIIDSLEDHAASTDQYCRILWALDPKIEELNAICNYLQDTERSIHSWQNFHLWLLLARAKHKDQNTLQTATDTLNKDLLKPECSAIFIYLSCVGESELLKPLVQKFSPDWPFYHQRNFLLATNDFAREDLSPLYPHLGTKIKGTATRAKPYFETGIPLLEREPASALDIYEEISPYD